MREGVIKFELEHAPGGALLARHRDLAGLVVAWRDILVRLSLVGADPGRYAGLGFGNVSARVPPYAAAAGQRAFLITGTQTGGQRCMSADDLALVLAYDTRRGWVRSTGHTAPSSESTTHAAIYDQASHLKWAFHVHSPLLWRWALSCPEGAGIPATRPDVHYGTPEMADEVRRLWRSTPLPERLLFAMAGHDDGLMAMGRTADEAGHAVTRALSRALADEFARVGALCR